MERRGAFEAGLSAWRGVDLEFADFSRHLSRLGYREGDALPAHADALYLCCACSLGNPTALQALERELRLALGRSEATAEATELSPGSWQALLEAAPGLVARYPGTAPLRPWLRVAVQRAALALGRERMASQAVEYGPALLAWLSRGLAAPAPAEAPAEALAEKLAGLPLRDQTLLRLFLAHSLGVPALARTYGLSESDVAQRLLRCRAQLLDAFAGGSSSTGKGDAWARADLEQYAAGAARVTSQLRSGSENFDSDTTLRG